MRKAPTADSADARMSIRAVRPLIRAGAKGWAGGGRRPSGWQSNAERSGPYATTSRVWLTEAKVVSGSARKAGGCSKSSAKSECGCPNAETSSRQTRSSCSQRRSPTAHAPVRSVWEGDAPPNAIRDARREIRGARDPYDLCPPDFTFYSGARAVEGMTQWEILKVHAGLFYAETARQIGEGVFDPIGRFFSRLYPWRTSPILPTPADVSPVPLSPAEVLTDELFGETRAGAPQSCIDRASAKCMALLDQNATDSAELCDTYCELVGFWPCHSSYVESDSISASGFPIVGGVIMTAACTVYCTRATTCSCDGYRDVGLVH